MKQVEKNRLIADEIKVVCAPCGIKFLTERQKQQGGAVTFHLSVCGLCGEETFVTDIRHYNYLKQP